MQMKIQLGSGSGHPHVPVMINGKGPFVFVFDTGASITTVSSSLVESLGIPTYEGEKRKARGVGGNELPVMTAKIESLEIGSQQFQDEEVGVIDFANVLGTTGCGPTAGVIGHTLLKNFRVSIHYGTQQLALEESNGTDTVDALEWIPFKYLIDSHLIGVPVCINGKGPFDHILDTGSSGNVMTPTVASEIGVKIPSSEPIKAEGCSGGECVGVGGRATGYGTIVQSISIGSATLSDAIMGVIDLGVISPNGQKLDYGIIGYPFLKDYRLIIDYPRQRLALVSHNLN